MKSLRRYLLLLFALAMSLGLFSIPVSAESNTYYDIHSTSDLLSGSGELFDTWIFGYPADENSDFDITNHMSWVYQGDYIKTVYHFTSSDGSAILKTDLPAKVNINNVYQHYRFITTGNNVVNRIASTYTVKEINVYYTDGSSENISNFNSSYVSGTATTNFSFSITPKKDIRKITLVTHYVLGSDGAFLGELLGLQASVYNANSLGIDLTVESQETGWLKQIFAKITNLWQTCEAGFANLVKGITELPQKLGEMIKGLFVPTAEELAEYGARFDDLLSDRLGAVYQCFSLVFMVWDDIMSAQETAILNFPSATIDLPGGEQFTFGGYEVQIIPDRFFPILEVVRMAVGVVCTLGFINGMRKRFDEVMGVEQ